MGIEVNIEETSPFFSIVIPIYNVEKYLRKCVDSVIEQEYKNIEIILVDDGSPDECPKICDEYVEKDSRVKVIHKLNGGLSSARNAGTKKATGKYIIFLDSDDYWNRKDGLGKIAERLQEVEADVLSYKCIDYSCVTGKQYVKKQNYDCELIRSRTKKEILKYYFQSGMFPGAAWLVVTRRKFIIENQLYFIEGIKAEDIDWLLKVYLTANKYDALNEDFYVYLKYRTDSITGTADTQSIDNILFTISKWIEVIETEEYEYIKNDIYKFLSGHYLCAILILDNISKIKKKKYCKILKEYKYLLKYDCSLVGLCSQLIYSLFGVLVLSKLLNKYRKMKAF